MSVDTSFLLVLPLFAWLISNQIPGYVELLQGAGFELDASSVQRGARPYVLGLLAAIGLFAGVVVHELGHALTARMYGVEVKEITLWFLGGVAQFEELPRQRGAEAVVGAAGPLTSLLVALACGLAWRLAPLSDGALFIASYLTVTNLGLAVFNLLPALPLDGGRILRSLLALAMPYLRATRIATGVSRAIALLLGVYGFLTFQLLLVAVAFFIYNAVRIEARYALISKALEGMTAREVMTPEPLAVDPDMSLRQFLELSRYRRYVCYPVVDEAGRLVGLARLDDAREAEPAAAVATIVRPADTIAPDREAMDAVRLINASESGRLLVVDAQGRLLGLISKTDLVRRLQHAEA